MTHVEEFEHQNTRPEGGAAPLVTLDSVDSNRIFHEMSQHGSTAAIPDLQLFDSALDQKPAEKSLHTGSALSSHLDSADAKPAEHVLAHKPEPAASKPADKALDGKPADKPASSKPEDKPAEKPADKPTDKPADKPSDKPAAKPLPGEENFSQNLTDALRLARSLPAKPTPEQRQESDRAFRRLSNEEVEQYFDALYPARPDRTPELTRQFTPIIESCINGRNPENLNQLARFVAENRTSMFDIRDAMRRAGSTLEWTFERDGIRINRPGRPEGESIRISIDPERPGVIQRDQGSNREVRFPGDGRALVRTGNGPELPFVDSTLQVQTQEGEWYGGGAIHNRTNRPLLAIGNAPQQPDGTKGDAFLRVIPPGTRTDGGIGGSDYDGVILDPRFQPVTLPGGRILMPSEVPPTVPVLKFSDLCVAQIVRGPGGNPVWQEPLIPTPDNRLLFDESATVETFTGRGLRRCITPQRPGQTRSDGRRIGN